MANIQNIFFISGHIDLEDEELEEYYLPNVYIPFRECREKKWTKYKNFGKPNSRDSRRIKLVKELGCWDLIIQLRDEYINDHTNEESVREKWSKINESIVPMMVDDYRRTIDAFDYFFETGETKRTPP